LNRPTTPASRAATYSSHAASDASSLLTSLQSARQCPTSLALGSDSTPRERRRRVASSTALAIADAPSTLFLPAPRPRSPRPRPPRPPPRARPPRALPRPRLPPRPPPPRRPRETDRPRPRGGPGGSDAREEESADEPSPALAAWTLTLHARCRGRRDSARCDRAFASFARGGTTPRTDVSASALAIDCGANDVWSSRRNQILFRCNRRSDDELSLRPARLMLRRAMSTAMRPIYGRIQSKLTDALQPATLVIKVRRRRPSPSFAPRVQPDPVDDRPLTRVVPDRPYPRDSQAGRELPARRALREPIRGSGRGDALQRRGRVRGVQREAPRREASDGVRAPGRRDQRRRARAVAEDQDARGGGEVGYRCNVVVVL